MGAFSTFEIVDRAALDFANLKEQPDGYVTRSETYDRLDPSERSAVSLVLGPHDCQAGHRLLSARGIWRVPRGPAAGAAIGGNTSRSHGRQSVAMRSERAHEWPRHGGLGACQGTSRGEVVRLSRVAPALQIALQLDFENGALNCTLDDRRKRSPNVGSIFRLPWFRALQAMGLRPSGNVPRRDRWR